MVLNTAEEKPAVLQLFDPLGRLLESRRIQCRAGINTISWNIAQYAAGSYYLTFENMGLKTMTIVKQ